MATTQWTLDAAHSEIQFKVKHMMVTTITGSFRQIEGKMESSREDFTDAQISFSAEIASISTGNDQRDGHLRSPEFFDADKFPHIKFVSTSFRKTDSEGDYELTGHLTIKDVTKTVTLKVEYGGTVRDPWGNTKAGFSFEGKINRKDFNLGWNVALEAGGVLVSEDVKLLGEVQLLEVQPANA